MDHVVWYADPVRTPVCQCVDQEASYWLDSLPRHFDHGHCR